MIVPTTNIIRGGVVRPQFHQLFFRLCAPLRWFRLVILSLRHVCTKQEESLFKCILLLSILLLWSTLGCNSCMKGAIQITLLLLLLLLYAYCAQTVAVIFTLHNIFGITEAKIMKTYRLSIQNDWVIPVYCTVTAGLSQVRNAMSRRMGRYARTPDALNETKCGFYAVSGFPKVI